MIFFSEMNTVICLPEDGDGIPGTFPKSEDGISALRIECAALIFSFFSFFTIAHKRAAARLGNSPILQKPDGKNLYLVIRLVDIFYM